MSLASIHPLYMNHTIYRVTPSDLLLRCLPMAGSAGAHIPDATPWSQLDRSEGGENQSLSFL